MLAKILSFDWFMDKATGRFKGCGIIEFGTPAEAQKAVALNGTVVLDRDMTIKLSKPPSGGFGGDRGGRGRGGRGGGDRTPRPISEKPEGCDTIFLGNLPHDITEDEVHTAFADCGVIQQVRWVERDGEFKGVAFVQFTESEATDKAIGKNGTMLKGRQARIDYAAKKSKF